MFSAQLRAAIDASKKAGEILLKYYGKFKKSYKCLFFPVYQPFLTGILTQ